MGAGLALHDLYIAAELIMLMGAGGFLNRRAIGAILSVIDISVTVLIHALQVAGDLLLARGVAAVLVVLMGAWLTFNNFFIATDLIILMSAGGSLNRRA
ncbi:MAG: hypothetical protein J1E60_02715, partial [Christensenellaceae bacterium]|nr:hypothetical protein [Christensenellaceae bacterium]